MTLQAIKAEDVRDGEPRWWCPDDAYASQTLEWIAVGNLHTEWRREADAFALAIVDRPAPAPTAALDLDALDEIRRIVEAIEHGSAPEDTREAHRWLSLMAKEVAALRWADAAQRRQGDAPIAEVRRLRAQVDAATSWPKLRAEVAKRDAEIADLRAKLAEAHALLKSAGDLFVAIQMTDGEDEHKAIVDGAKLAAVIAAALEAL